MKLNDFNAGKSIRLDPSLIAPNEARVLCNVDNTAATLKSCLGPCLISNQFVSGYIYNYNDVWVSSNAERSYVEYQDILYYTENDNYPKRKDSSRELLLGIQKPTTKLTSVQTDPSGTEKISASAVVLQYVYTYYNSQDGIESAPSPVSDELSLSANKIVTLTNIVSSTDIQVDKIRIYRLGSGATEFTLVEEIANNVNTYVDIKPTLELDGRLLESEVNLPAKLGAKYLIEAYGIFFYAVGSKLYFSRTGFPAYWPESNVFNFSETITGLLPVINGILVFSRTKTSILLGRNSTEFVVEPVSEEQGCISHLSCKTVKNMYVWVSLDGICTYSNGIINVLSLDKLGKITLEVVNVAVYNEQYFLCLNNGSLLCMDMRFNPHFKDYKFDVFINNIHKYNNKLYARSNDKLYELFKSECQTFHYKSPKLTEGDYTVTKLYNNIYMRSDGEFEVKIIIDKQVVHEMIYTGDKIHDILSSIEDQRGSSIQFDITGKGTIYEIEYKVLGRDNGR